MYSGAIQICYRRFTAAPKRYSVFWNTLNSHARLRAFYSAVLRFHNTSYLFSKECSTKFGEHFALENYAALLLHSTHTQIKIKLIYSSPLFITFFSLTYLTSLIEKLSITRLFVIIAINKMISRKNHMKFLATELVAKLHQTKPHRFETKQQV